MNVVEEFWRLQGMIDSIDLPLHMMLRLLSSMSEEEWGEFRRSVIVEEVKAYYEHLRMLIDGILMKIEEREMEEGD